MEYIFVLKEKDSIINENVKYINGLKIELDDRNKLINSLRTDIISMKKYNIKQNDAIIKQNELNDMIKLLEEKITIREDEL
jgi:hypothetical protein